MFSRVWPTADQPQRWWKWEGGCFSKLLLGWLLQVLKLLSASGLQVVPTIPGVCRKRLPRSPLHRLQGWEERRCQTSSLATRVDLEWDVQCTLQEKKTFPEGWNGNSILESCCFAEIETEDCHVLETGADAKTVRLMWTSSKRWITAKDWQNGTRTLWKHCQEQSPA